METEQIMSAIFLIAVMALILPGFLSTNNKLKQFLSNLSIWTIVVLYNYCNYLFLLIHEKINLAITGCMGRMGRVKLIKSSYKNKSFKLVALTENKKNK